MINKNIEEEIGTILEFRFGDGTGIYSPQHLQIKLAAKEIVSLIKSISNEIIGEDEPMPQYTSIQEYYSEDQKLERLRHSRNELRASQKAKLKEIVG